MKFFNSQVAGAVAGAIVIVSGVPNDGETVTVPGDSPSVFTFAVADPGGVTWIDTSTGAPGDIATNLAAAMPTSQYTAIYIGSGEVVLTWNTPSLAANANAVTTTSSVITISGPGNVAGFVGGLDAGTATGDIGASGNYWNDSGNTDPFGSVPNNVDVTLQDAALIGTGVSFANLSATGAGAVAGATVACTAADASVPVSAGTLVTTSFVGSQSGGNVTLNGAPGTTCTYQPVSYTGGSLTLGSNIKVAITAGPLNGLIETTEDRYVLGTAAGGIGYGTATKAGAGGSRGRRQVAI